MKFRDFLPVIGMSVGLCVISAYPAMEFADRSRRAKIIDQLNQEVYEEDTTKKDEILLQARSYNQRIAGEDTELPPKEIWPYEKQLSPDAEDAAFGSVLIPKISLSMPVYHGTDEAVLTAGVGHLEGTSLPTGGLSTHTVASAHSGMKEMKAFDDIRELEKGDVFCFRVQGDVYAYRVYAIETVWPNEMESLNVEKGRDLATLVTCTPYGINDHRLLVHGERCPAPENLDEEMKSVTLNKIVRSITNRRVWPFLLAFSLVLLVLIISVLRIVKEKKKKA